MFTDDDTSTDAERSIKEPGRDKVETVFSPGLLIPKIAAQNSITVDRCRITASFIIGRAATADLQVYDKTVSKHHCLLAPDEKHTFINDLGSRNGTYLNGYMIGRKIQLDDGDIIRVGESILIYKTQVAPLLVPPLDQLGIVGRFHAGRILADLKQASLSSRHLLLTGPSGSGKEVAARALSTISDRNSELFIAHNAARFSSEEEATSTLFGVGKKVFSGVNPRPGLIEQAHNGILFLDEAHNLPNRVQKSLLRVLEDNTTSRIGEINIRQVEVLFIFASNEPGPTFSIAHDLLARLRQVDIPPLSARTADIPDLFQHLLIKSLNQAEIDTEPILDSITHNHYEKMCLYKFPKDNVRGIMDLADRITTGIKAGQDPATAINETFNQRFSKPATHCKSADRRPPKPTHKGSTEGLEESYQVESIYERNRDLITETYTECRGNIAATVRILQFEGVTVNRGWLTMHVKKWNLPPKSSF